MATFREKVARLFRGKKKDDDKRTPRTKAIERVGESYAGEKGVVEKFVTPAARPKLKDKPAAKQPERKTPEATAENIDKATALARYLEEQKKKKKK